MCAATHSGADDVEEGEDSCARMVDDVCLENIKVSPACAASIYRCGYPGAECKSIRRKCCKAVAQIGVWLCSEEMMAVKVDKSGRDIHAGGVDCFLRLLVYVLRYFDDLVALDCNIHDAVDLVLCIDHMTILDEKVDRLRVAGCRERCDQA